MEKGISVDFGIILCVSGSSAIVNGGPARWNRQRCTVAACRFLGLEEHRLKLDEHEREGGVLRISREREREVQMS